jgi:hypothetical protein
MGLGAIAPPAVAPQPINPQQSCYLGPGQMGREVCGGERVMLVGGALATQMLDPQFMPFEQMFRALPEEGMFDAGVSPQRPFAFEIGAFKVDRNMALCVFDLRPDVYRFSGLDPADAVPVEARRFSSCMGFDITLDQHHLVGQIQYQLDPRPISHTGTQAFNPAPGGTDLFTAVNINQSSNFGSVAGAGTSLLPQRPENMGAPSIPFMLLGRSNQVVQLRVVIFRPLPSPIAFIEYTMAGLLIPEIILDNYLKCMKPMADLPR